jgi:hypothetical protein
MSGPGSKKTLFDFQVTGQTAADARSSAAINDRGEGVALVSIYF